MEQREQASLEELHPEARDAAEQAAKAAGLPVEEWVSRAILSAADNPAPVGEPAAKPHEPTEAPAPVRGHPSPAEDSSEIEAAAAAAGVSVEQWLSRAVLQSLAEKSDELLQGHRANAPGDSRPTDKANGPSETAIPTSRDGPTGVEAAVADVKSVMGAAGARTSGGEDISRKDVDPLGGSGPAAHDPVIDIRPDPAPDPFVDPKTEFSFADHPGATRDGEPKQKTGTGDHPAGTIDAAEIDRTIKPKSRPEGTESLEAGATRLAEIINRTRREQDGEPETVPVATGNALIVAPSQGGVPATIDPPRGGRARSWITRTALLGLAVIAGGIWAMPRMDDILPAPAATPDFAGPIVGGRPATAKLDPTPGSTARGGAPGAETGKPASPPTPPSKAETGTPKVVEKPLDPVGPKPGTTATPGTKSAQAPGAKPTSKPADKPKATAQNPGAKPGAVPPSKTADALPTPPEKHVPWYRMASDLGNTKAQVVLAGLYLIGQGVPKDTAQAAALYRKAASEGNAPDAQFALSRMLLRGEGVAKDPVEALLWQKRAALGGHAEAAYQVGLAYATGTAAPRDYVRARRYFELAAKRGIAPAHFQLGALYENGLGVRADRPKAIEHYKQGAAAGDAGSTAALGRLQPKTAGTPKATPAPKTAGKPADGAKAQPVRTPTVAPKPKAPPKTAQKPPAPAGQGFVKREQLAGLRVPAKPALTPRQRAGVPKTTAAQIALAKRHLRGEGVPRDPAKAALLFRVAAIEGRNAEAQYAYAVMLDRGLGVRRNRGEAVRWYREAARSGHPDALLNIGYAYATGDGVRRSYGQAHQFFRRAAAKNVAEAQYNLGRLYERGLGVRKDVAMAFKWYSLAVANRNAPAGRALDRLIPQMSDAEIARAKDLLSRLD